MEDRKAWLVLTNLYQYFQNDNPPMKGTALARYWAVFQTLPYEEQERLASCVRDLMDIAGVGFAAALETLGVVGEMWAWAEKDPRPGNLEEFRRRYLFAERRR